MTFSIRVQGGTGAGRRVVREPRREPWTHKCAVYHVVPRDGALPKADEHVDVTLDASWTRCPACGTRRP